MTSKKGQSRKKISWESLGSQLGNLNILLEILQRASGPGESTAGVTYLSMKIHPKAAASFP